MALGPRNPHFGQAPSPAKTPVALELSLAADTVAAFHTLGQSVAGELTLVNEGTQPQQVRVQAATSDRRWRVRLTEDAITLDVGETRAIPLTLLVPDDAWSDRPVIVSLAALAGDSVLAEVDRPVRAVVDAPLQNWAKDAKRTCSSCISFLPLAAISSDSLESFLPKCTHIDYEKVQLCLSFL